MPDVKPSSAMPASIQAAATATAQSCVRWKNVFSVDVEDYFHAESFTDIVQRSQWQSYESRVENNTRRLLDLCSEMQVEATFFVLGWVAERFPALVREIAARGHELACHSYWHRLIYKLDPKEFREDTSRAKQAIEQAAGVRVYGYRAPTYSIVTSSLWATEILAELGFSYDSSIFPIHHDNYGIPDAPRFPFRISTASGPLREYPIATFLLWGSRRFPFGGGGYLRLLPWWYNQLGLRHAQAEGLPVISYTHPWEIDPQQPRLKGRLKSRLRHYTNLDKTYTRLEWMLSRGGFTSFRNSGLAAMAEAADEPTWGDNGSRRSPADR
jgi:polysaccharide deacetylase family protein (PEP-CTERM system associated)